MFSKDLGIGQIASKLNQGAGGIAGGIAKAAGMIAPKIGDILGGPGGVGSGKAVGDILAGLSGVKLPGKQFGGPGGAAGGAAGAAAAGGKRTIRQGSSGTDVARCQNLLNMKLAFNPPPLWVDGIFGANTDRKAREFQMKAGLTVDGIVGPQTWAALES